MAFINKSNSGSHPQCGAIFMSNQRTKQECFDRKLFGLPYAMSDFVKEVKAGMTLFLFEYERRKLYGVFEAISDGEMNIMPHAYCSSRRSFPAQVKFRVVWRCLPLSEGCFRDAIKDNYYAPYKFRFGLSREQVDNLLFLFHFSTKESPKSLIGREFTESSSPTTRGKSPLVSDEVDVKKVTDHEDVSSNAVAELGDYIPLVSSPESQFTDSPSGQTECDYSSPGCSTDKHSDTGNYPEVKCLQSDYPNTRTSVFSRLKFDTQSKSPLRKPELETETVEEVNHNSVKQNDFVDKVLENLQTKYEWMKANEGLQKKGSVFSRLSIQSNESSREELRYSVDESGKRINEKFSIKRRKKKRDERISIRNDDSCDNNISIRSLLGNTYGVEDRIKKKSRLITKEEHEQACGEKGCQAYAAVGKLLPKDQQNGGNLLKPVSCNDLSDAKSFTNNHLNIQMESLESFIAENSSGQVEKGTSGVYTMTSATCSNSVTSKDKSQIIEEDAKLSNLVSATDTIFSTATKSFVPYQ